LADQRISQLIALSKAGISATDVLPVADISASETKKVTVKDLIAAGIDLVDTAEIDLAKLDQNSATKITTIALEDGLISAPKLGANSTTAVDSVAPVANNFTGRHFFNSVSGNLQVYDGAAYSQVILPEGGIGTAAITNSKLAAGAVTTDKVSPLGTAAYADSSVTTAKLADLAVTTGKLALGSVTASQIATGTITGTQIANSAISTALLANGAVTTAKLADTSITTAKITDLAITGAKIADTTIDYSKLSLADGSVPAAKLSNYSISALQLAPSAVETTALADASVTSTKLGPGAVTATALADGSVSTTKLVAGAVTSTKLATGAVISDALGAQAVTTAALAEGSVTTSKLALGSVTTTTIGDAQVTYAKLSLTDGVLPGAKIAADSITASQIAGSAVGTTELATGAVTTAKLADASVTTAKLGAASVTGSNIATGAITSSLLSTGSVTYPKLQATTTSNVLLGRATPEGGQVEEIPCTAQGRTLLAGATATEQRTALGLGPLSTATGTWVDGSSFSGTSSGTNTGDQTITLTGAVTGSGSSTFDTTLSNDVVVEANIATGAVTSAKLALGAVTAERLSDNSASVVSPSAPSGNGAFIGQHWINTSTAIDYVWNGTSWLQEAGITVIASVDTTPIAVNVSYPDPYSAILTTTLETQGAGTVWAGPASGDDATPTFRDLVSTDLPVATTTERGAVLPGTGLTIPETGTGVINHSNAISAGAVSGITYDAQGHITAATALIPSDIPELDASKIGTGAFSTARIADDAITGAKLADYSTAKLGEVLPVADYIGQIFLNPLDKAFFMWDGNVWVPIGISAGEITFAGTYDASTNTMATITSDGAAVGLVQGQPLPTASSFNNTYYVVVSKGGTGTSPAPAVTLQPPDILLSNGTSWTEVDVSSTYVAQNANNVAFTPAASLASTTVQNALEEVSTECRNASNLTSGTVAVARGGTGLTTYTKGNLLTGNASNVLGTLTVGTNGQVLTADSTETLGMKWTTLPTYVSSVSSSTAALTIANPTTTPSFTIRAASTSVNGLVQLTDSVSTTSSALAATATAVKTAYDLANAALPKAGGVITGDLQLAANIGLLYEGNTIDAFQTRIYVAEPTADRQILFPDSDGTLATIAQLDDGFYA
jgi:hypothetical protein